MLDKSKSIEVKAESRGGANKENNKPATKEPKENIIVQKAAASNARTKFSITVKTGNKMAAGTDAVVTLIIYGSKSSTQPIVLQRSICKNTDTKDLFERNSLDVFEYESADIGKVTRELYLT